MAQQTLWKGSIQFSGHDVPVKLHSLVKDERIHFHLLHGADGVRLSQQMICSHEKIPVPAEEQVKGYEIGKTGKYIILDPEELDLGSPGPDRSIKIREFVKSADIDPLLVEHVYGLTPDGAGGGYRELAEVLAEVEMAGVCTWTMRKRSYLGALVPRGDLLRLCALRYADELAGAGSMPLAEHALAPREVEIGRYLIDQLSAPFEPEKLINVHEKKLKDLIEKKARGEKIALLKPKVLDPTTSDKLLQALEASLNMVA